MCRGLCTIPFASRRGGSAFDDGPVSTIAHLTGDKLRAQRFPFPTFADNEQAGTCLEACIKTDCREGLRRQIQLVQEYRTRIVADAVTGNLDVREAAAQLPEEALKRLFDHGIARTPLAPVSRCDYTSSTGTRPIN